MVFTTKPSKSVIDLKMLFIRRDTTPGRLRKGLHNEWLVCVSAAPGSWR